MEKQTIDHLRRLIISWKNTGLIEDNSVFNAINEDIETFIALEDKEAKEKQEKVEAIKKVLEDVNQNGN